MRLQQKTGGRSINLALSHRGLRALEETGVDQQFRSIMIPMKGRMIHDADGKLTFQPYGKEGQTINSVSRRKLNEELMTVAEQKGAQIHFNSNCLEINLQQSIAIIEDPTGNPIEVKADLIIGADGAFSKVRKSMEKTERFDYSQSYVPHGYKELSMPAQNGEFAMGKNALHIWPRGQYMLIALPNNDKSFTCTLFLPFEGPSSFQSLQKEEEIMTFFHHTFPDAAPLMTELKQDFLTNPTSPLVSIACYPWVRQRTVLIGDAAHAIVPFYGQGMNAGFEDCRIFNGLLDQYGDDWENILNQFQKSRKPNADAIKDLALQNFVEMRDLVADPKFLIRKKIEAKLNEIYPQQWIPEYTMVTFTDIPYSQTLEEGNIKNKIMDEVMTDPQIKKNWENLDFGSIVQKIS